MVAALMMVTARIAFTGLLHFPAPPTSQISKICACSGVFSCHFRSFSKRVPTRVSVVRKNIDSSDTKQDNLDLWENKLASLESDKLYGIPSKESELDQFVRWLEDDRLNLFPVYQREYVWKPERASRLIVTVLCNRLVPAVVLHEKEKGVYDVVDGKQRLCTLLSWLITSAKPELLKNKNMPEFKELSKLDETYEDLNGLSFNDLDEPRRKAYQGYSLTYTIVPLNTRKSDVFEVYNDINSGGEHLTPQQVRRSVYYGAFIMKLDELVANNADFQAIYMPSISTSAASYVMDPKEADRELILRAFAFDASWENFKTPLKSFLNSELDRPEGKELMTYLEENGKKFALVMSVARDVFGEGAFRVWECSKSPNSWGWSKSISLPMWDALYSVLAELLFIDKIKKVRFQQQQTCIVQSMQALCKNGKLDEVKKNTAANLKKRRNLLEDSLRSCLDQNPSGGGTTKRLFNRDMIPELCEKQDGKCALCQEPIDRNRLDDPNYVHIDHKVPFSKGGSTDPENAQLTHASCNLDKGAKGSNA